MQNRKVNVPKYLYELHGDNPNLYTLFTTYLTGLIAGFLVIATIGFRMPVWKTILLFILYTDIAGGIVANFSSSTNHYYQINSKLRLVFILLHFIHPVLFILLFPNSAFYFAFVGVFTIISCLILNTIRVVEDQQTIASFCIVIGIIVSFSFNLPFVVLYSFAPLFMVKLINGFSVKSPLIEG